MPEVPFRHWFLSQRLIDGPDVCQLLTNPDESRLVEKLVDRQLPPANLIKHTADLIRQIPAHQIYRFVSPTKVHTARTELRIEPPERSTEWSLQKNLPIHYVWWVLDSRYQIALIPALGLHAVAVGAGKIEDEVRREVRSALTRNKATRKLAELVHVARFQEIHLHEQRDAIDVPSPRQFAESQSSREKKESTLKSIGRRLKPSIRPVAYLIEQNVARLAERLMGSQPSCVLLVGPSGSGKTATFHQLVRTASQHQLDGTEFWQTDGSRLIAGMSGFGQWQQRLTDLVNELDKKSAVIHLGNLVELMETGKGGSTQTGIADFLRPFMIRRKIIAVAECTTEQLSLVEKRSPQFLDAFFQLNIESASEKTTGEILLEVASHESGEKNITIQPQAIAAISQLHTRFATYSAKPGRSVRFLRNLFLDLPDRSSIDADLVTQRFADDTGLPAFLIRDREPLDLAKTHNWFSERIVGQPEPVSLIVDLLAVVKSSLNQTARPIASLMFIGPTGVGKTQTAKALAEFMYRDEKRMVRFDMSEYADPFSAARLIGGIGHGQGLLTGRVRENPFTVVLLDEFEKAHPAVFDLLLQVLGEGRLTDGYGRLVDFSTSVIIMTSNLGAKSFRESATGFRDNRQRQSDYRQHFTDAVRRYVRPEFFNRINRVVPFAPLDKESVCQIAARELNLVQNRFGITSRPINIRIHKSAPQALAELGHDMRFGARPLKRTVQRLLVQPLARQLMEKSDSTHMQISVHAQKTGIHFSTNTQNLEKSEINAERQSHQSLESLANVRRRMQALAESPIVRRLNNWLFREQQNLDRKLRKFPIELRHEKLYSNPELLQRKNGIDETRTLVTRIDSLLDDLLGRESELVTSFLDSNVIDVAEADSFVSQAAADTEKLILDLFLADSDSQKSVSLVMFGRFPKTMNQLLESWVNVSGRYGFQHQLYELRRYYSLSESKSSKAKTNAETTPAEPAKPLFYFHTEGKPLDEPNRTIEVWRGIDDPGRKGLLGYAMEIRGNGAFQIFFAEKGLHVFNKNSAQVARVFASGETLRKFQPPAGTEKLPKFSGELRRTIEMNNHVIRDRQANKIDFEKSGLVGGLVVAIENSFRKMLNERIGIWN